MRKLTLILTIFLIFQSNSYSAVDFTSGSTDTLSLDSTPVSDYPFTVSAWIKPSDTTTRGVIFFSGDKDVADQWFAVFTGGDIVGDPIVAQASSTLGGDDRAQTSVSYRANVWQHVCAVFASSTSRDVYIDGKGVGSNTASNSPLGADRIRLGRYGDSTPSNTFAGSISEVFVWNVALNEDEVVKLGRAPIKRYGYNVRPRNIVSYYPMDDFYNGALVNALVTVKDRVGNFNLTPANTPISKAEDFLSYL